MKTHRDDPFVSCLVFRQFNLIMHCRELETYCFSYISSLKACNGVFIMNSVCARACFLCLYVLVCCCFQSLYGLKITQISLSSEISSLIVSFLQQVPSLFQSEFSKQCSLVHHLSNPSQYLWFSLRVL
jgi:hypothetical protein